MEGFRKVLAVSDVSPGSGRAVTIDGKEIAVFNVDGAFYAITNDCPHRGGPLAEGKLDGAVVSCPWHGWQFDVRAACFVVNPASKIESYEVRVENGDILIRL